MAKRAIRALVPLGVLMPDAGWVAGIVSGVTAVVGKGLWDWALATGKVKADREARAEARQDKRVERRDDLQRQTLLDLEDAVPALCRTLPQLYQTDLVAHRAGVPWGTAEGESEIGELNRQLNLKVRLLASRVADENTRAEVKQIQECGTKIMMATKPEEAMDARTRMAPILNGFMDRVGQLIRDIDAREQ